MLRIRLYIFGGLTAGVILAGVLAPHRVGPADIYPPVPGVTNTDITQDNINQTICNPLWSTSSIRPPSSYTSALKLKQMKQLGLHGSPKAYEEDHLISLELGGSPKDPNNLWPEAYTASIADGGARQKDQVENQLHRAVCQGSMTLKEAQHIITTDWYAYTKHQTLGSFSDQIDQDDE